MEFGLKLFTSSAKRIFGSCPLNIIFHTLTPPNPDSYKDGVYISYSYGTTGRIYVPDSAVNAYKEAWTSHASQIYPLSAYDGKTYY